MQKNMTVMHKGPDLMMNHVLRGATCPKSHPADIAVTQEEEE